VSQPGYGRRFDGKREFRIGIPQLLFSDIFQTQKLRREGIPTQVTTTGIMQ
jgi:hypothetical protein